MIYVSQFCNDIPMETMGERLQKARIAAGYSSKSAAARRLNVTESAYRAHENGQNEFGVEAAISYAKAYNVSPAWLLLGGEHNRRPTDQIDIDVDRVDLNEAQSADSPITNINPGNATSHESGANEEAWQIPPKNAPGRDVRPAPLPAFNPQSLPQNVPVMGVAEGALEGGAFQWTSDVIDYVRRPPALANAKNLYALYVVGESMAPQFSPGDLIFVNPNRPAGNGDAVVVQMSEPEDQDVKIEGMIAVLIGPDKGAVRFLKHNPHGTEIEISRSKIRAIHRVLSNNELYGL